MTKLLTQFTPLFICAAISVQICSSESFGAKTRTAPDLSNEKHPDVPPTSAELQRAGIVNITPAPPLPQAADESAFYFKYRSSISLRGGAELALNDLQNPGAIFGVLYAYALNDLRGVEAGADLTPDGSGTLHFARRELIGKERFRWFYKYGAGVRVVGSDQLVTFLRIKNWQARLGGGVEWSTFDTISFRFDGESIFSTENMKLAATAGVAFAF